MILWTDTKALLDHLTGGGHSPFGDCVAALPRPHSLTVGVFDGLHLAHQALVRRAVEARIPAPPPVEAGAPTPPPLPAPPGTAIVFTFSNHPLSVLAPPYTPKTLLAPERKVELLEAMGVDVLVMPEFSSALALIEPEAFVRDFLCGALQVDRLIVGYDFRFGHGGAGNPELLLALGGAYGFEVTVVPAIHHEDRPISSTLIRELIDAGRVRAASELLGRPYELEGPVLHGLGRGATIGFPTANIRFDPAFATPAAGVYAVRVLDGPRVYSAMMNLGTRPTFSGTDFSPEVYLFDFSGELYGHRLRLQFVERLREERKFASVAELQDRLRVDERLARAVLNG